MIDARRVVSAEGVQVEDVRCRHRAGHGAQEVHRGRPAIVLVRRGYFVRSVAGRETSLDPTLAYCMNDGVEHRYDHANNAGDDCTAIFLDPEVAAGLWGGDPTLPDRPLRTTPSIDLQHRRLLADARRGLDPLEIAERALTLAGSLLADADEKRGEAGRPGTQRARRALVDGVREALNGDLGLSLDQLARELAVSPYHLSRVFRQDTGVTIARYRMRLRLRHAFERLLGGEDNLARVAADTGFADQSHLYRVVRAETSQSPMGIRELLTGIASHEATCPSFR